MLQIVRQRLARNQLHDDEGGLAVAVEIVNLRDVGMVEARQRAGFLTQRVSGLRVQSFLCRRGQDLDGDIAVEVLVAGAIHLPHAAGANDSEQTIVTQ